MSRSAYIKLVPNAAKKSVTTTEIMDLFTYYKEITMKAGEQTNWDYANTAFPYEIKEKPEGNGVWFYLHGTHLDYHMILLGISKEEIKNDDGSIHEQPYIQVTLPEAATCGDKAKANEFCKFLAKKLQAELHLFNGRIMYYYPRK